MSTDLKEQIRTYIEYFDTTLTPEFETSVSKPVRYSKLGSRGWAYAVAAAVAVLVVLGGINLWISRTAENPIADQDLSLTDWNRVENSKSVLMAIGGITRDGAPRSPTGR